MSIWKEKLDNIRKRYKNTAIKSILIMKQELEDKANGITQKKANLKPQNLGELYRKLPDPGAINYIERGIIAK